MLKSDRRVYLYSFMIDISFFLSTRETKSFSLIMFASKDDRRLHGWFSQQIQQCKSEKHNYCEETFKFYIKFYKFRFFFKTIHFLPYQKYFFVSNIIIFPPSFPLEGRSIFRKRLRPDLLETSFLSSLFPKESKALKL